MDRFEPLDLYGTEESYRLQTPLGLEASAAAGNIRELDDGPFFRALDDFIEAPPFALPDEAPVPVQEYSDVDDDAPMVSLESRISEREKNKQRTPCRFYRETTSKKRAYELYVLDAKAHGRKVWTYDKFIEVCEYGVKSSKASRPIKWLKYKYQGRLLKNIDDFNAFFVGRAKDKPRSIKTQADLDSVWLRKDPNDEIATNEYLDQDLAAALNPAPEVEAPFIRNPRRYQRPETNYTAEQYRMANMRASEAAIRQAVRDQTPMDLWLAFAPNIRNMRIDVDD